MSKAFAWTMKSPVTQNNYFNLRPSEPDKVFDNLVPVQMQLSPMEERKHFLRLSVELISSGISTASFRKVRIGLLLKQIIFLLSNELIFYFIIINDIGSANRNN